MRIVTEIQDFRRYLTLLNQARRQAERLLEAWPEELKDPELVPPRMLAAAQTAVRRLTTTGEALGQMPLPKLPPKPPVKKTPAKKTLPPLPTTVTSEMERAVGIDLDPLTEWFALIAVKGFGPQKAKELHQAEISPADVLTKPSILPGRGANRDKLVAAISALGPEQRAASRKNAIVQINWAAENESIILTYGHPLYPSAVLKSNNPIPVLYARGAVEILKNSRTVACVGSRGVAGRYATTHAQFASWAARHGWTIVSGFAVGADTIGHKAAVESGGTTICVMPCGLDHLYPPENQDLWSDLLRSNRAVAISEFPFGTTANAMHLKKRNKLTVAVARGVLVSQSAVDGGAMNAVRAAVEQRKPLATFESDGEQTTSGNLAIIGEHKVPVRAFPAAENKEGWAEWLQMLYS